MKALQDFLHTAWCKQDWSYPYLNEKATELLNQCTSLTVDNDVMLCEEKIMEKSRAFPIPFPVETVRIEQLKKWKPIENLRRNIVSTYPLIHERVLLLMANFLAFKRQFGTSIEKIFYKDMSVNDLIDRILKKRAVTFVGPYDKYKLLTGEEGIFGWEEIGTSKEKPPLLLENCLSYDEMKLSAMVYVSGYTVCINDGKRRNCAIVEKSKAEGEAIIIGTIGPRFQRFGRMDFEDILVTQEETLKSKFFNLFKLKEIFNQQTAKKEWRKMWAEFYQIDSRVYKDVHLSINSENKEKVRYLERYFPLNVLKYNNAIFDNEAYYKRISILAETVLLEADYRAKESSKSAFVNVIGCGLGVWMISPHQSDLYLLTFLDRIMSFLEKGLIDHVTDVNFAYIKISPDVEEIFTNSVKEDESSPKKKWVFFENKSHPKGGINVQMQNREPSSKLRDEHAGKLLVITYPWDSNAHPGNEFWFGSLESSGDPAAACSTQVSELHNAHINDVVCGQNTRVAGRGGLNTLTNYCRMLTTS